MNIGQLKHRIEFQNVIDKIDKAGFPIKSYETFQRAWADINDLYGKEYWNSKQVISENVTEFHTRYFKDVDMNCFIYFNNNRYEIIEIDNIKYANKELKIKAKLQVINGN